MFSGLSVVLPISTVCVLSTKRKEKKLSREACFTLKLEQICAERYYGEKSKGVGI